LKDSSAINHKDSGLNTTVKLATTSSLIENTAQRHCGSAVRATEPLGSGWKWNCTPISWCWFLPGRNVYIYIYIYKYNVFVHVNHCPLCIKFMYLKFAVTTWGECSILMLQNRWNHHQLTFTMYGLVLFQSAQFTVSLCAEFLAWKHSHMLKNMKFWEELIA
jgi:hypothetical protein